MKPAPKSRIRALKIVPNSYYMFPALATTKHYPDM